MPAALVWSARDEPSRDRAEPHTPSLKSDSASRPLGDRVVTAPLIVWRGSRLLLVFPSRPVAAKPYVVLRIIHFVFIPRCISNFETSEQKKPSPRPGVSMKG